MQNGNISRTEVGRGAPGLQDGDVGSIAAGDSNIRIIDVTVVAGGRAAGVNGVGRGYKDINNYTESVVALNSTKFPEVHVVPGKRMVEAVGPQGARVQTEIGLVGHVCTSVEEWDRATMELFNNCELLTVAS